KLRELFRAVVSLDRKMSHAGAQVLSEREYVAIGTTKVFHGVEQLFPRLSKTAHDTALRKQRISLGSVARRPAQHFHSLPILRVPAHLVIEVSYGLGIVIEDVGPSLQHFIQSFPIAAKVRYQNLDFAIGIQTPHPMNGLDEMACASIGKIVAINRRDHGV